MQAVTTSLLIVALIILMILSSYTIALYLGAKKSANMLEIDYSHISVESESDSTEVHNPTMYNFMIKNLTIYYYLGDEKVGVSHAPKQVWVPAGCTIRVELENSFNPLSFMSAALSGECCLRIEIIIEVDAYAGPVKLGSFTVTKTGFTNNV